MEEDSFNLFKKLEYQEPLSQGIPFLPQSSERHPVRTEKVLQELSNLTKAKERFKEFLDQLGDLKKRPIREDIISYCGDPKKSEKVIEHHPKADLLLKKMDIRIDKMIKTRRIKRNWGQEDLKILVWIVSKYCDLHGYTDLEKDITDQDWKMIASYIPGVTPEGCMFKWLSIKKITLANYRWLEQESLLLEKIVLQRLQGERTQGIKEWKEISQQLYRLNEDENKVYRNAKQCKEHWNCHLNPQLKKGLWQPQQDIKLLKFIRDNKGLKKWSQLSKYFDGRTQNALKNRHKLIVQKLQKQGKNKHKDQLLLISEYLQKLMVDQLTSNIKVQDDIFQSNSEIKVQFEELAEVTPLPQKKTQFFQQTQDYPITPARVEKFDLCDLKRMDFRFIKSIQPGMIESNGIFKKMGEQKGIQQQVQQENLKSRSSISECKYTEDEKRSLKRPFEIIPLSSFLQKD